MPPQKKYPQKWPFIDGHSMKAVNGGRSIEQIFSTREILDAVPSIQGWFPVYPCTDIEIYHIGQTDALSAVALTHPFNARYAVKHPFFA
jgi:hypothetical protein